MYLLIVEDEDNARESMEAILTRNYPELIIHSASDGEEAMARLELVDYALVLADVQMPRMDGLSMLEQINRYAPRTLVIIISAYDYFYYAQRALRLGAFDYILKPFEEERIKASVNRALAHRRSQDLSSDEGEDSPGQGGFLRDGGAYLKDAHWGRILLMGEQLYPGELPRRPEEWQRLCNSVQERLPQSEEGRQFWAFPKRSGSGLLTLAAYERREQDRLEQELEAVARVMEELQQEKRARLCLSLGTLEPMRDISLSQIHAEESLHYLFYDRSLPVIWIPSLSATYIGSAPLSAMREFLEGGTGVGELADRLREASRQAGRDGVTPKAFKEAVDRWIGELLQDHRSTIATVDLIKIGEIRSQALEQEHLEQYLYLVCHLLKEVSRLAASFNSNKNAVLLEKCVEYIEKNYANPDLSLQSITEHFFFNPSYFSTLFKKQTGKTIMQYLAMVRIDSAKELLRNTDIRINDVAARVGFSDMRYFMRVFKSETGMTPGTYRRQEGRKLTS